MATQQDEPPPFLRVKLVDIQITQSPPLASFAHAYRSPIPNGATSFPIGILPTRVPLIKIFGATPRGQSVSVNVHGVWPYFFVDYPQGRSLNPESVHRYTHRLANSLNAALCQTLRQDSYGDAGKQAAGALNTNTLHVASVVLVKGVPFYGYHVGYEYYLKVSLVTPSHVYRAVGLLAGGGVMGTRFACYESHLASKLQFMIDFDLYGCGWVDLDGGLFREPLPGEHSVVYRRLLADAIQREIRLTPQTECIHPSLSPPPTYTPRNRFPGNQHGTPSRSTSARTTSSTVVV